MQNMTKKKYEKHRKKVLLSAKRKEGKRKRKRKKQNKSGNRFQLNNTKKNEK